LRNIDTTPALLAPRSAMHSAIANPTLLGRQLSSDDPGGRDAGIHFNRTQSEARVVQAVDLLVEMKAVLFKEN
jgi:hypothetical protein